MADRQTYTSASTPPITGAQVLDNLAEKLKLIFDQTHFRLTSVAGTGNAVTASLDPVLDASGLVAGMLFTLTWAAANTGGVTLSINGGTPVAVLDADGTALGAGALQSGRRALLEFTGGNFRILTGAADLTAGGGAAYQAFTASGTWTKPSGYDPETLVLVQAWGGGGGGGKGTSFGGGGGGAYAERYFRMSELPASVAVTVGAGGSGASTNIAGTAGGDTTFGSLLTAFGGGGGGSGTDSSGGGGGGTLGAGVTGVNSAAVDPRLSYGRMGGGYGAGSFSATAYVAQDAKNIWGGGGGAFSGVTGTAGDGVYGGGGGGATPGTAGARGLSLYGGNGGAGVNTSGATATAGAVRGGGGGGASSISTASAAGGRGECRVWIIM